ncbi:MAG: PilZ domain-containing protein [Phycisphaerales bacterium]|jgi:hypothetical protein|nr:PilZ domain-containing protein [Phycisphaerales bacterium]
MDNRSNERRQHKRHKLTCPITLFGRGGQVLVKADTADLSHGGAYVTVDHESVKDAKNVNVAFSIPDTGPDHQMEGFAANATVLRQDYCENNELIGLALQFTQHMHLPIEA